MGTSRAPAVIDALVSTLGTALSVTVFDGPELTGAVPQNWVNVGYDGDPEGEFDAATATQSWAGLGAKVKNEPINVVCAAVSLLGEGGVKAGRDRVYSVFADVENALRADPSLGLAPPTVAGVTEYQYFQEPTSRGMQARIAFTVSVTISQI